MNGKMSNKRDGEEGEEMMMMQKRCERVHRALQECHRRIPDGRGREIGCRHLNRSLAECFVSVICPEESEAVRSMCSSGGTSMKRSQCQQAQFSLSLCLSSHQNSSS